MSRSQDWECRRTFGWLMRMSQEHQRAVMHRELDHRVKNNLASIMSLARMSVDVTESQEEFLRLFEADAFDAIDSLQDMITNAIDRAERPEA